MSRNHNQPKKGPIKRVLGGMDRIINGGDLATLGYESPGTDPHTRRVQRVRHITPPVVTDKNGNRLLSLEEQLQKFHESVRELGRVAMSHVGSQRDITSAVEIIRPLPQDNLFSEKLRRRDKGQGFTRSQYMGGVHQEASEKRRFHVMEGRGYEGVRGFVLPYAVAGMPPLTKLPSVRSNNREEDLAIALDGSGRTWSGILVPHDPAVPRGTERVPTFGVVEDPKSKATFDNAVGLDPIPRDDTASVIDATIRLAKLEDRVIGLQKDFTPYTHHSHSHQPR